LFHKSGVFGACIIHILYTECAKIKKNNNNSGAKRLRRESGFRGYFVQHSWYRRFTVTVFLSGLIRQFASINIQDIQEFRVV